jgi:hypothetical protein
MKRSRRRKPLTYRFSFSDGAADIEELEEDLSETLNELFIEENIAFLDLNPGALLERYLDNKIVDSTIMEFWCVT